jgi:hypothetical protein
MLAVHGRKAKLQMTIGGRGEGWQLLGIWVVVGATYVHSFTDSILGLVNFVNVF